MSGSTSMQVWRWQRFGTPDGLQAETRPIPVPGPGQVLLRLRANSLNQRDLMYARGTLPRAGDSAGVIPLCDGAGDLVALGPDVDGLAVGDRVMSLFFSGWQAGPFRPQVVGATLGSDVDGLLAQYALLPAARVMRFPDHLSYAEAASLPCAAVTAWSALFPKCRLQPGETVLVLGSGGVALFTLQMARAAGARVILTTSSDARAERLMALGAHGVVNYRRHADWPQQVRALTEGAGADVVVETGGGGTYVQSLQAAGWNARVALVGLITGFAESGGSLGPILMRNLSVCAVQVGSRYDAECMLRFIDAALLRPIIDSRHAFDRPRDAYRRLESGQAFGKVVIDHDLPG